MFKVQERRRRQRIGSAFIVLTLFLGRSALAAIELTIDSTKSQVDVELCIVSVFCESGESMVTGIVAVGLDCPLAPEAVRWNDFSIKLQDSVELFVVTFGGFIRVSTVNVAVASATPDTPLDLVSLTEGTFSYDAVDMALSGGLRCCVDGNGCPPVGGIDLECNDAIDLSLLEADPTPVVGELSLEGTTSVTVSLRIDVTAPVYADNPELMTVRVSGTIVATGVLPSVCCDGDLNADDTVNVLDLRAFARCLGGPTELTDGACRCADLNDDDRADLKDVASFLNGVR